MSKSSEFGVGYGIPTSDDEYHSVSRSANFDKSTFTTTIHYGIYSTPNSGGDKTLQQEVHGDNLNDFVACLSAGTVTDGYGSSDTVTRILTEYSETTS